MHASHRIALALAASALSRAVSAQVKLYLHEGFQGPSYTTRTSIAKLARLGFNDRASSIIVTSDRWEVCDDVGYAGHCLVLRKGQYPSLAAMGLNDCVSSVRPMARRIAVDDDRYAPAPLVQEDYRRRSGERLFEAPVTVLRAVMGPHEQRCWIEHERVEPSGRVDARVPSALLGAVIGGTGRDVQHCSQTAASGRPAYWDVSYTFRGQAHRVQLAEPPGRTVTVDRNGEPRV